MTSCADKAIIVIMNMSVPFEHIYVILMYVVLFFSILKRRFEQQFAENKNVALVVSQIGTHLLTFLC